MPERYDLPGDLRREFNIFLEADNSRVKVLWSLYSITDLHLRAKIYT